MYIQIEVEQNIQEIKNFFGDENFYEEACKSQTRA